MLRLFLENKYSTYPPGHGRVDTSCFCGTNNNNGPPSQHRHGPDLVTERAWPRDVVVSSDEPPPWHRAARHNTSGIHENVWRPMTNGSLRAKMDLIVSISESLQLLHYSRVSLCIFLRRFLYFLYSCYTKIWAFVCVWTCKVCIKKRDESKHLQGIFYFHLKIILSTWLVSCGSSATIRYSPPRVTEKHTMLSRTGSQLDRHTSSSPGWWRSSFHSFTHFTWLVYLVFFIQGCARGLTIYIYM